MNKFTGNAPSAGKAQPPSPRASALQKYSMARSNLLLMTALTLVNLIILSAGSQTMLLFSATIPYLFTLIGLNGQIIGLAGQLPLLVGLGFFLILPYFFCWLFSKKNFGWMIAALVLFVLDTAVMVCFYLMAQDISGILDVVIHIWVLYYLIVGIRYGALLKQLPEEPVAEQAVADVDVYGAPAAQPAEEAVFPVPVTEVSAEIASPAAENPSPVVPTEAAAEVPPVDNV